MRNIVARLDRLEAQQHTAAELTDYDALRETVTRIIARLETGDSPPRYDHAGNRDYQTILVRLERIRRIENHD